MNLLSTSNPVQMVIGELLIQAELAERNHQFTFGMIAADCMEWATDIKDVMEEIVSDAETMAKRIELYAADGIFDRMERDELIRNIVEIMTEAREGVIL